jgi:hypothetical protein
MLNIKEGFGLSGFGYHIPDYDYFVVDGNNRIKEEERCLKIGTGFHFLSEWLLWR